MVSFTTAPTGTGDYTIDRGLTRRVTPRIIKFQYGDGYEQRALQGINPLDEVYAITLRERPKSQIDEVVQFFEAQQAITVFAFKPPHLNEQINANLTFSTGPNRIQGTNFNATINTPETPERLVITNTSLNDGSYTVDFSQTNDNTNFYVLETLSAEGPVAGATIAAGVAVIAADWNVTYNYGDYWTLTANLQRRYEP